MRAGHLDRTISLLTSSGSEPNRRGVVTPTWEAIGTYRAGIVTLSTEEFLRLYGEVSETVVIFRTRYLRSLTTAHRIGFEGRQFDVKEVKEIGRRKGLELRCEEVKS